MVDMIDSVLPLKVTSLAYSVGGVEIIRDVSFVIERGSRNIILGANGAGKSVLLRLLHGLLPPSGGEIKWSRNDAQFKQAMVFQRPVMLRRTARENIEFALHIAGSSDVSGTASKTLESVGLAHLADRPARLCSGGEQQRIALARAWALAPEVLFLDEPTASLDPTATKAIEEVINAINKTGTTIIMTTHDIGQAKRIADRVFFLHRERLIEDASATQFFDATESREAAAFIKGELLW
jgi:tungstate transport system ATP-binding protein